MLRTHRLSSRSTARNAPKAAESAPRQPARWLRCTRARGPCPWRIIGIGIGAGIGIGMGVGNSCGSQDHPQALLIACAASSHTVESDVSRRARTRATRAESGRAAGGCCAASAFATKRNISGQRGMDDLDGNGNGARDRERQGMGCVTVPKGCREEAEVATHDKA